MVPYFLGAQGSEPKSRAILAAATFRRRWATLMCLELAVLPDCAGAARRARSVRWSHRDVWQCCPALTRIEQAASSKRKPRYESIPFLSAVAYNALTGINEVVAILHGGYLENLSVALMSADRTSS